MSKKIYEQPHVKMIQLKLSSALCAASDPNAGNESPGGGSGASLDLKFEEEDAPVNEQ